VEGVRKRLAVGAIWTAGGRVVINLIALAGMLVLARLLTPEDFGLVAIATILFAIINSVTELSSAAALIQHKDPQREDYDTAWTLNVLRALLVSVALCISAYPAAAIYGDDRLIAIMYVLGAVALLGGLANPRLVEFRRRLSFHQEIFIELATRTVGFVVGATIAYVFRSYWALVIASLAAQVAGLALSYALIPFMPRPSLTHWRSQRDQLPRRSTRHRRGARQGTARPVHGGRQPGFTAGPGSDSSAGSGAVSGFRTASGRCDPQAGSLPPITTIARCGGAAGGSRLRLGRGAARAARTWPAMDVGRLGDPVPERGLRRTGDIDAFDTAGDGAGEDAFAVPARPHE
jgi:hypothetical protein